jgi:RHS repeat-associated protein
VFDANGNAINMSFDPENQLETVINSLGFATTYEYDDRGNIVQIVDALGGVRRFEYGANGKKVREVDALGNVSTFEYDATGNMTKSVDGNGLVKEYRYEGKLPTYIANSLGEFIVNTYTSDGKLLRSIDERGLIVSSSLSVDGVQQYFIDGVAVGGFKFNGFQGTPTEVHSVDGTKTYYTYDSKARLIRERTVFGNKEYVLETIYDDIQRTQTIRDSYGNEKVTRFDSRGLVISETGEEGTVTYEYDYLDRPNVFRYSDGTQARLVYDSEGRPITYYTREGLVLGKLYDALGRVTELSVDGEVSVRFEYDLLGRKTKEIYADGSYILYGYERAYSKPSEVKAYDKDGILVTWERYEYDEAERKVAYTNKEGETWRYIFGAPGVGTATQIINPDGTIEETGAGDVFTGRPFGSLTQLIDGAKFTYDYDAVKALITKVTDEEGYETQYVYDDFGRLVKLTSGNGDETYFVYDNLGRRVQTKFADGTQEVTIYESANVISVKDRSGVQTRYTYGDFGVDLAQFADGTELRYEYDVNGRLVGIRNEQGITLLSIEFNDDARWTKRVWSDGSWVKHTFNERGLLENVASTGGHSTSYVYDQNGYLIEIDDSRAGRTSYLYDDANLSITVISPNGTREVRKYTSELVLSSQKWFDETDNVIASFDYEFDSLYRLQRVDTDKGLATASSVRYTYDKRGQLQTETYTDGSGNVVRFISYEYDGANNRTRRADSVSGETTYVYNSLNQLVREETGSNVTTYTYDLNGNLIRKQDSQGQSEYQWDLMDRLVAVEKKNDQGQRIHYETYTYDALGNRVGMTVNGQSYRFLLDDKTTGYAVVRGLLDEYGNLVRSYVYGDTFVGPNLNKPIAQVDGDGTQFLGADLIGSTRLVTNGDGNITGRYDFDAYGRILREESGREINHLYTGEWYSAPTGLTFLRARYMDANTGRFISSDPVYEGVKNQPASQNRYIYTENKPTIGIDPTGLFMTELVATMQAQAALVASYASQAWTLVSTVASNLMSLELALTAVQLAKVAFDIYLDYVRANVPLNAYQQLATFPLYGGWSLSRSYEPRNDQETGRRDKGYDQFKSIGVKKIEWGWRPVVGTNLDAGGWAGRAFNLGINAFFTVESNKQGTGFILPFVPKNIDAGGAKLTVFGEGSLVRDFTGTRGNFGLMGFNYAVGASVAQDINLTKDAKFFGIKAKALASLSGEVSARYNRVNNSVEKWTGTARAGLQFGVNVGIGIEIKPRIPIIAFMLIGEERFTRYGSDAGISTKRELRFVPFGVTLLEDSTNVSPKAEKLKAFSNDPTKLFNEAREEVVNFFR